MKCISISTNLIFILALTGLITTPDVSYAGASSKAKVLEIKGEASYMKAGAATTWEKLDPSVILEEKDSIKTGPNSEVKLELMGAAKTAELVVGKDTTFKFDTFQHEDTDKLENTLLNVEVGKVLVKAEKLVGNSKFEVKTPTSIVGIRGTVFEVDVLKSQQ